MEQFPEPDGTILSTRLLSPNKTGEEGNNATGRIKNQDQIKICHHHYHPTRAHAIQSFVYFTSNRGNDQLWIGFIPKSGFRLQRERLSLLTRWSVVELMKNGMTKCGAAATGQ